jgi:PAS domain S-box-containing protein
VSNAHESQRPGPATAEAPLRAAHGDVDEIEALAGVGSWEWEIDADVVRWSDELHRIYGEQPGIELSYAAFLVRVHPEDRERVQAEVERALREATPFEFDHRIVRRDGEVRTLHARGRVSCDAAGRPVRMRGTGHDVTARLVAAERERALLREQAAREAAEHAASRFRFLSEASEQLGSTLDIEETLRSVTRLTVPRIADWCSLDLVERDDALRRVEIAGIDPELERFAQEVYRRYPAVPRSEKWYARALRRGEPVVVKDFDETALREAARDADHLAMLARFGFCSAMVVPMMARDRVVGLITLGASTSGRRFGDDDVSLVQSLADRAALAIENARLFQEARAAARVREEVVQTVSHDLRSPLAVIAINASLLREELSDTERKTCVERVERAVERMQRMIGDLLDAARLEAGALAIRQEPEPVAGLLADACELAGPSALVHEIAIRRSAEPTLRARADRDRVVQALANLLDNAVRHSPPGGHVDVEARSAGDAVLFSVTDGGPGVAPRLRERIFQRFWSDAAERTPGAGLGLAIVRGLVELHGGRVWVEDPEGGGARFCFTIPAANDP